MLLEIDVLSNLIQLIKIIQNCKKNILFKLLLHIHNVYINSVLYTFLFQIDRIYFNFSIF